MLKWKEKEKFYEYRWTCMDHALKKTNILFTSNLNLQEVGTGEML